MEETIIDDEPKRPQFITVLCVLTFIGVGVGVLGSIIGWWGAQAISSMMDGTSEMAEELDLEGMPGMEEAMAQLKYINLLTTVGIIGSLVCLIGALQMWKLKKSGFYIYVVGEITPVIISASLMGGSAFAGLSMVMGAIIPATFVVLYAINLKHMT